MLPARESPFRSVRFFRGDHRLLPAVGVHRHSDVRLPLVQRGRHEAERLPQPQGGDTRFPAREDLGAWEGGLAQVEAELEQLGCTWNEIVTPQV